MRGEFRKKTGPERPLVSIITIVRNGEKTLEKTIQSVLNQTYDNIEYIVIDGGSLDRTLDIIHRYEDRIAYWASELDNGIYDAMNKGIDLAAGEWINFMNAGDEFYEPDTIRNIFIRNLEDTDLIYGHTQVIYTNGFTRIQQAEELKKIWKKMIFSHQSAFFKTEVLKKYKFKNSNKHAADFEVIYTLYTNGYNFYNSGAIICKYLTGGFSDAQRLQGVYARFLTVRKSSKFPGVILNYVYQLVDQLIKDTIKKVLPDSAVNMIIRAKYKLIKIYEIFSLNRHGL